QSLCSFPMLPFELTRLTNSKDIVVINSMEALTILFLAKRKQKNALPPSWLLPPFIPLCIEIVSYHQVQQQVNKECRYPESQILLLSGHGRVLKVVHQQAQ